MAFMAAAAPFLQVAGVAVSALSAIQKGRDQQDAAETQATVLEQQAQRNVDIAREDETDLRNRVRRTQATARARLGGSGVTPSGSASLVADDLASEAELQALRIRSGGATSAHRLRQEAALERFAGKRARRAGFFRAAGGAIGGLSAVNFGRG